MNKKKDERKRRKKKKLEKIPNQIALLKNISCDVSFALNSSLLLRWLPFGE